MIEYKLNQLLNTCKNISENPKTDKCFLDADSAAARVSCFCTSEVLLELIHTICWLGLVITATNYFSLRNI